MELPTLETLTGAITTPRVLITCAALYILSFGPRITRIFGHAHTEYTHSRKSITLRLKDGSTTTLDQLCKSAIPPCRLSPFLFNGHLQTIWTAIARTSVDVYYKRKVFEQEDPNFPGQFAIDFVTKPNTSPVDKELPPRTTYFTDEEFDALSSEDVRPMLVTLHGLSGGSHELYLREVLAKLCNGDGGWEACVVNSRGCAESKITSSVLYNARATWDVRQTVKLLRKKFPNRPLFGCGFSLGGNIMTNYIGEEGDRCELKAGIVLSNPWNLEAGSKALMRTWMGYNIYSKAMGKSLKALFEKHIGQLSKNPNFDVPAIKKLQHLREFDYLVQCASWGYPTASAYYRDASSTDSLLNIRIPFLSINAEDDPIVHWEALPWEEMQQTPYGVLCTTALGGHLSWFELGGGRWFATAAAEFLRKMAVDVDLKSLSTPSDSTMNGHVNGAVKGEKEPFKQVYAPLKRKWASPDTNEGDTVFKPDFQARIGHPIPPCPPI